MAVAKFMLQKVLFLATVDPFLNFDLVQNFIFYVQVLAEAETGLRVCAYSGEFKDKRAAEVSRLGQEAVCLWIRRRLWHIYQCKLWIYL